MKLTNRGRLVAGAFLTIMVMLFEGVVGLPPAFTPTQAEALIVKQNLQVRTLAKYTNADSLTDIQLVGLLKAVGFKGQDLKEAWAVAKKESHGNPLSHNGNRKTGDNSYGLFQVNMLGSLGDTRRDKYSLKSNAELLNPVVNAQVAYHMSNGGKDWSAWKGVKTKVVKYWLSKFPSSKQKS
ncbi:Transglycosylase SLT domain 1 [uncultured Caudovirales phage]|uniref:Transglycosylase SLT domain 1 n=1 Tax=uncultured Caudovirales phage TaxID=2100421 RepID=A0A6J5Q585_9CAUD|nr:Transglycosylase SLT domain 1 [uncultured Caudovirales phage]CAB4174785.1 Transglycosylase SLT domain 1 [uncultured Caudovirales phage]CAB4179339.1 Transglycosylase SLT domain 1 [uncultured Caudovirales phage]CAB4189118.1 Transglycosylase SLT domain 1 [uncultured Caudovirales phage]CAB4193337.1 Transglycosylase SLT domain 1 [uncultured Caudovirales phage]